MTFDETSTFKVVNYSTNCLAVLNYNRVLQTESEKQQKFATIPITPELQSSPHIISVTQVNIYHNVTHQNQEVLEEKGKNPKSRTDVFSKIQPLFQVALSIRCLAGIWEFLNKFSKEF
ncbi:MAG: hypothetical protein AB3A66_02830 [Nodularia sp. CChRGM 3473]